MSSQADKSHLPQTDRATRCITLIALHTKIDAQCDQQSTFVGLLLTTFGDLSSDVSSPWCCIQRWTVSVINWRRSPTDLRRAVAFFCQSPELRTKFWRKEALLSNIPKFLYYRPEEVHKSQYAKNERDIFSCFHTDIQTLFYIGGPNS